MLSERFESDSAMLLASSYDAPDFTILTTTFSGMNASREPLRFFTCISIPSFGRCSALIKILDYYLDKVASSGIAASDQLQKFPHGQHKEERCENSHAFTQVKSIDRFLEKRRFEWKLGYMNTEFPSMAKRSTKFFVSAIGTLLVALGIEEWLTEAGYEGFILVAIAFTLYAAYASITNASVKIYGPNSSLAYVCSILTLFTTLFLTGIWLLGSSILGYYYTTRYAAFTRICVPLAFLGGILSFIGGRQANREWEEYNTKLQKVYRTPDHGIPITSSG